MVRKYHCVASNVMYKWKSFPDKLSVHVKPNYSVTGKGRIAHFTAIATGISTNEKNFKYQWKKVITVFPIRCQVLMEQY